MNNRSIVNALKVCYDAPYFKNQAAVSGKAHNVASHENFIELQLNTFGFIRATAEVGSKKKSIVDSGSDLTKAKSKFNLGATDIRDAWTGGDLSGCLLNDGEYIVQPCGKNDSPDFLVRSGNRVFAIESKSAKEKKPVFNSGFPNSDYIYIFTSEDENKTVAFLGSEYWRMDSGDLLNEDPEFIQLMSELREKHKQFSALMKSKATSVGADHYLRDMWTHSGNSKSTNYFNEPRRSQWFERVIGFIEGAE